jgi:glutathione S-transferase
MAELPILYSFRRCPYAMRARMAIAVSGVEVEHREILLRDKPAEMLAASPKGTVPVLVLPDGDVIDESLDVMRWALAQSDPENWLGGVDNALIATNDGPFKADLDRYKYPTRFGLADTFKPRELAMMHLTALNDRLSVQACLTGDTRAFTDIALFPFMRQFANTDREWFDTLPLPSLQKWLEGLIASDLFETVMVKHLPWNKRSTVFYFD